MQPRQLSRSVIFERLSLNPSKRCDEGMVNLNFEEYGFQLSFEIEPISSKIELSLLQITPLLISVDFIQLKHGEYLVIK